MSRRRQQFKDEVVTTLRDKFEYKNDLQIPKLEKIIVSRGINSEEARSSDMLNRSFEDLALLTGQKPIVRKARKSIASFKIREGMPNGIMVTLRGNRMYDFFDQMMSLAAPRIRDFQGFKARFDGRGNLTVGFPDQRVFPTTEDRSQNGFQVVIVTTAKTNAEARALLEGFGFPFVGGVTASQAR